MPVDSTLNRDKRLPVGILFGDMKGSTEEAELDEASAVAKLREYETVLQSTSQRCGANFYKVKYEGDGFMATFATAHSMVECGVAVRREFQNRGWKVRLGGHYGEAFSTESGDFVGADVNRAARIQSAADAGACEFLVSDTVASIVRDRLERVRFEAHEPITAKGVREHLHVFRVAEADRSHQPARTAPPPSPLLSGEHLSGVRRITAPLRTRTAVVAALAIALAVGGWLAGRALVLRDPFPKTPTAQTITVMKFENQRADENDWYAGMLQAAFNTELSKIPDLSVIAPEIVQRDAQRSGISPVETAERMGVERFVTGSFAVYEGTIRIDARIVTTDRGVQEAAEQVEGRLDDFFALQKQLALATLDHFQVKLTMKQQQALRTTASSAPLDKYQKFLRAEGVAGASGPPPTGSDGHSQRRWRARVVALGRATRDVLFPAPVQAQPIPEDDAGVRELLETYRRAQENGDVDGLARLHVSFSEGQRSAISEYFQSIDDLRVALSDIRIEQRPEDLAVSYIRKDAFTDKESGEPVTVEVRVTKFVVRDHGTLKFADFPQ